MSHHADNFDTFEFVTTSRPTPMLPRDQARTEYVAGGRGTRYLWLIIFAALGIGFVLGRVLQIRRYHALDAVASVNGTIISKDQFLERLQTIAGDGVLRSFISEELGAQFAWRKGVRPTDAEVEVRYAEAMKHPDISEKLIAEHISPEAFKRSLRLEMDEAGVLGRDITLSDTEVHNAYLKDIDPNNPRARYFIPEIAQLAVIVTAKEAVARLAEQELASGVPFATVAQQYSEDASASDGGRIPEFARGRTAMSRIPGLETAIFGMKPHDTLGPRQFGRRWWIIRCLDMKPSYTAPFESVKDECVTDLKMEKGRAINHSSLKSEIDKFDRDAAVQIFWPQYLPLLKGKR